MKCEHCGAKLRKNDEVCKNCGKELYESQFEQEAKGLEIDMKYMSAQEIQMVTEEQKNNKVPITYEEFKVKYYRRNPLPKILGLEIKGKMLQRYAREQKIKSLYEEYLYKFDGQDEYSL